MGDTAPAEPSDTPDFKQYEATFAEYAKEITAFPNDVLTVTEEKKQLRALDRTLFDDTSANYGFVAFSRSYLAQEWSVMSTKGETAKLKSKAMVASKLPELLFEVDEAALTTSSQESPDVALQRWVTEDVESNSEPCPILPLVSEIPPPSLIQAVPQAHPYQERLGEEVAIEALELTFGFGQHEPFFCTLALYDAKEQRKISEDFVFQVNTPEQLALVGVLPNLLTPTVQAKKAVFRLSPTSKHADIYAFLVVSKVLSGDLDETYELYSKQNLKEKDLKKATAQISETCGRLSKFRQVFAWGAAPIFEPDGSYKSENIYSMELSRVKTDMWSLIDEVKEGKKIKAIPGLFRFFMTTKPTAERFCNRLTPSLAPVQPEEGIEPKSTDKTKEIQEFTSTNEYPYPWVNYVNNYYVYLQKVDLSSLSGRNICVEVKFMDSDADPEAPGMAVVYADSTAVSGPLIDRYTSTVIYHSQAPKMLDEIAIKLPTQVTDKHHLLISFYHINVAVKKSSEETKSLIARTFIPLLKDHQIIRQKNVIRIASKLLPGYMTKEESVSYIGDKKAALTIYARVISSVYPLEGALHKFLRSCEWDSKSDWTKIIAAMKGLFDEKTNRRQTVRYLPVVMRTLFQHLMSPTMALSKEAFDTLLLILESISNLTKPEDGILEAYLTFVFNAEANETKPGAGHLYEKLIEQWMNVLNEKDEAKAIPSLKYSWFLVGIALKSMLYTLTPSSDGHSSASDKSADEATPNAKHGRKTSESKAKLEVKVESNAAGLKSSSKSTSKPRLGADWVRLMSNFTKACADFVRDHHKNAGYTVHLPSFHVQLARLLGETTPHYLDKGSSFEIIWGYFSALNLANIDMFTYKALMLKIFVQRVDFAALNVPVLPSFSSVRDLPRNFLQRHFLVGLILKQVEFAYVTNNLATRMLVLDLIADALHIHETDPRLTSKQRTKIIQTYFPFVLMMIDRFEILRTAPDEERTKSYAVILCILRNTSPAFLASYWRKEAERRIYTLFEMLTAIVDQFEWNGAEETLEYIKTHTANANARFSLQALGGGNVDSDDTVVTSDSRGALARQMSIGPKTNSPNISKDRKKKPSKSPNHTPSPSTGAALPPPVTAPPSTLPAPLTTSSSASFQLPSPSLPPPLDASLPSPIAPSSSSDAIAAVGAKSTSTSSATVLSTSSTAISAATAKDSPLSPRNPKESRRPTVSRASGNGQPEGIRPKESKRSVGGTGARAIAPSAKDLTCAANLSFQASVVVLEVMNVFVTQFESAMARRDVFENAFRVLIHLFRPNQSTAFLTILQRKWYFWVSKWGTRLFLKRNSICGDLVTEVLTKCNSRVATTRSEASTLLTQIFKVNYQLTSNVDRSRLQATIGITKLVGQTSSESFGRLFSSFAAISKYFAGEEKAIGKVVEQLETKIRSIITDNLKIQQFEYDPETIVDLYYGISKQLLDHPDERITMLDNLAEYHKSLNQLEESAQTKIITAALVQQYLSALDRWEAKMVPVFGLVCPSVQEEIDMPHVSALMTLKGEVCQASVFSSEGFAELIKQAIEMLKRAGHLELAVAAYRMLLPIYQMSEDYKMQQMCHADLYTLTGQLNDEIQMKQRIFSNYYRVSIFGKLLGADLDGQTFIYREHPMCKLAQFRDRLVTQYARVVGGLENVIVMGNGQTVVRSELDDAKCYLQIANVELFLTPDQQVERATPFKQHFGANRFVMEQPFSSGTGSKTHAATIENQWLRRTIYSTPRAFPFPSKRIRVTSSEDQELSPIEYAEALIAKKVQQLRSEMSVATPNLKTLQLILQGTLLTQVNAGAGAIIQAFLSDEAAEKYPKEQREKLADVTIEFDRSLIFAVKVNKKFMEPTADQTLLQEELEKGHQRFHAMLDSCQVISGRHASRRNEVAAAQKEQAELANKKLDNKPDMAKKGKSKLWDSNGAATPGSGSPSPSSSSPSLVSKPSMRSAPKSGK
jgi:hypothetical protein